MLKKLLASLSINQASQPLSVLSYLSARVDR